MQERSERTRRRLVKAGAEMFQRNGYAQATLGDIARTAGVTKGALYFHFASKDELAEAVQQGGATLLGDAVHELRAYGASPMQTLVDITHWLARTLHDDPVIPASFRITKECAGRQPAGTDFHRAWIDAVCTLLGEARDAGQLRSGVSWASAESLVAAAACGIEVMAGTGMPYEELRRRVGALWELLLPCLVPAGTATRLRTTVTDRPAARGAAGRPRESALQTVPSRDGRDVPEFLGSAV
ncbi:ScbR family autoregulator-binding transcription factor [Streptomyces sp. H34-S4]|uniref:ScbR family autoregulator-binding transcription factor n=1 Tax=Streptomyces sp. H34-S4 TaxID=2996463 RepID=UPI00227205C0|nr:ScbR family autoregulator-binding transcription factor [Streptomyces sp. H34-S4]MCY0935091.1 ScbR family autoregulator-binding transcription factor [Streptomyces sp. H34-S4]